MYLSKLVQRAPTTCFSCMIPDGEEGILTQLADQLQVVAVSSWGCGPLIPFGGSESLVLGCFPIISPQPPLVLSSFLLEFSFQRSLKLLLGQLVLSKASDLRGRPPEGRIANICAVVEESKCPFWFGLIFLKIQAS